MANPNNGALGTRLPPTLPCKKGEEEGGGKPCSIRRHRPEHGSGVRVLHRGARR